jgi:uncharacterized protein
MFALICTDKPGGLDIRKENRAKHLDYIAETGVVVQAGPFLSGEGEMSGSLVILDLDNRHEAEAWAKGDPYAVAGLFAEVRIEEWKKVVG